MHLSSVKAIITGGASGLGRAVAEHLLDHGAQVSLLDVQQEAGEKTAAELGENAHFYRADVTSEADVVDVVSRARTTMEGLNVVINCAGILGAGRVLGRQGPMPLDTFQKTVMVNLVGSFNVAKAAAALMAESEGGEDDERGVIINTASVAAYEGQIGQAAYSASKGGIVGMTLPMAREFTRIGVRVMTIAPGVFHTPMVDTMPENVQEALNASVPYPKRLGKPEEFAEMAAHIIHNRYLNGSTIRLDGAVRLEPK